MKTFTVFITMAIVMVIRSLFLMMLWNLVICRVFSGVGSINVVQSLISVVSFSVLSCKISFRGAK